MSKTIPSMIDVLKQNKVKLSSNLKNEIEKADKLTVVVLKSGEMFVFKYSTSPPPRYDKMKSLKLIDGNKIEGDVLEKVQKVIKQNKTTFTKTMQGKLFV